MPRLPVILPKRFRPKSKAGKAGMIAGGVVGGLLLLDLIGFVATAYFSAELLQYAERAGVAGLLQR